MPGVVNSSQAMTSARRSAVDSMCARSATSPTTRGTHHGILVDQYETYDGPVTRQPNVVISGPGLAF